MVDLNKVLRLRESLPDAFMQKVIDFFELNGIDPVKGYSNMVRDAFNLKLYGNLPFTKKAEEKVEVKGTIPDVIEKKEEIESVLIQKLPDGITLEKPKRGKRNIHTK